VAFSSLTNLAQRAGKITNQVIIGINVVLYGFMILIIILFNQFPPTIEKSCGNRVVYPIDYDKQKQVSVAYAAVIAGISFLMATGFLGFGLNLHSQISGTRKMLNQKAEKTVTKLTSSKIDNLKLFYKTLFNSIVFLLHCIFILVLSSLEKPNIAFSCAGLILTEVLPSLYVVFTSLWRFFAIALESHTKL
jgi:hypothetical protein